MLRREVFKAKDKMTEKLVTLKEVAMENEEEDVSSLLFVFVFFYFSWQKQFRWR